MTSVRGFWNPSGALVTVCTSSTRPATPTEGQQIYETDTDKQLVWVGAVWREWANYGASTDVNPAVIGAATTPPTIGTGGGVVSRYRYYRWGRMVHVQFEYLFGSSGAAAGVGEYRFPIPFTSASSMMYTARLGSAVITDASGASHLCMIAVPNNVLYHTILFDNGTDFANVGAAVPWTWAAGDFMIGSFWYEAAS